MDVEPDENLPRMGRTEPVPIGSSRQRPKDTFQGFSEFVLAQCANGKSCRFTLRPLATRERRLGARSIHTLSARLSRMTISGTLHHRYNSNVAHSGQAPSQDESGRLIAMSLKLLTMLSPT